MALDKVPYNPRGHMVTYVHKKRQNQSQQDYDSQYEWRDNTPFLATMQLLYTSRGMSAARFVWNDEEGHHFEMFMKDMADLVMKTDISKGKVTGHWQICKRGQNYGLQFVE